MGSNLVVEIPEEVIREMGIQEGMEIRLFFKQHKKGLVCEVEPEDLSTSSVNEEFARQVSEFIEEYVPALRELGK